MWSVRVTPGRNSNLYLSSYVQLSLIFPYKTPATNAKKTELFQMIKMPLYWRIFEGLFPLCILTFLNVRWGKLNDYLFIIIILYSRIISAMKAATRRHNNISSLKRRVKYNKEWLRQWQVSGKMVTDRQGNLSIIAETLLKISPLMLGWAGQLIT